MTMLCTTARRFALLRPIQASRAFCTTTNNLAESLPDSFFQECAEKIYHADALFVTSGAGMSVDSGLPDYRSQNGFWSKYPALEKQEITFDELASPSLFESNIDLAWGFYSHRLKLYNETSPHAGYDYLLEMCNNTRRKNGYFVFTSNVDSHFLKANFNKDFLCECHGNIENLQCLLPKCEYCMTDNEYIGTKNGILSINEICSINRKRIRANNNGIHTTNDSKSLSDCTSKTQFINLMQSSMNQDTMEIEDWDKCIPKCLLKLIGKSQSCMNTARLSKNEITKNNESYARPNIFMFNDSSFNSFKMWQDYDKRDQWISNLRKGNCNNMVVIEIGAGPAVPRIRKESESAATSPMCNTFIRINSHPLHSLINKNLKVKNQYAIPSTALYALERIYSFWRKM